MLQLLAHCYMLLHPPKKSPYCRSRITVQERNRHYPKAFSWNFAPPRPLLSGKFQLMSTSRRVDVVSAAIRQCFTPPNATICCNCSGRLFVSFLCAFWTAVRKTSPAKSSLVAFAGLPVGRWNVIECLSIRSSMQTDGKSMHHACQRLGEVGGGQRGLQHNSALKAYFIIAVLTGREEGFSPFAQWKTSAAWSIILRNVQSIVDLLILQCPCSSPPQWGSGSSIHFECTLLPK